MSTPGKEEEEKEKSGGKHIGPVGRSFFGWARAQCSDSEDRESVAPNGSISIANTYTHTHTHTHAVQCSPAHVAVEAFAILFGSGPLLLIPRATHTTI